MSAVHNPFPGLRPFRGDEEHLFFGRESQVDRMIAKLAVHRFLAVIGTSGSGKSSLVNCGLRPALHRGNLAQAGAAWRMAQFRPGSEPIANLAAALAQPGVLFDSKELAGWEATGLTAQELIESTLRLGSLGLVDIVEQARLPGGTQLLVVADQFEELFRYHSPTGSESRFHGPSQEAIGFVKLLLEAHVHPRVPIHVVLTMRSDFLGESAQFLGLAEAINEGQYLVPRLTRDEVRAAICGPVGVRGGSISPILATRLLNDVGDNPDQLSILQHALNRTWANWEQAGRAEEPLDLMHYEAVGGMADALNRHAEEAYAELGSERRQELARRIFKTLTDKVNDPRGVRRPTRLGKLCEICGASAADVEGVLNVFRDPGRSFLMPPNGEPLTADSWIDISHESLMRLWLPLTVWAAEEADSARTYRRLSEDAQQWQDRAGSLLRDPVLRNYSVWRGRNRPTAAWAEQYQGNFDSSEAFLKGFEGPPKPDQSAAELERWWLASRWAQAMALLDQSLDAQNLERLEAEVERRWLASRWRYAPMGSMLLLFVIGQIRFEGYFLETLRQDDLFMASQALFSRIWWLPDLADMLKLMAHLVSGMPAFMGYLVLAPYTELRFKRAVRAAIEQESAAEKPDGEAVARNLPSAIEVHGTGYAGFWRRALAHLIDWAVLIVSWTAVFFLCAVVDSDTFWLFLPLSLVLFPWLYHAGLQASRQQATWGMRVAGIFATDLEGRRLGFWRASGRHVASFLSYYAALLGFLMLFFNERRQTLHDRISGTVILRRTSMGGYRPEGFEEAQDALRRTSRGGYLLAMMQVLVPPSGENRR